FRWSRRPRRSARFPYTTLFRSRVLIVLADGMTRGSVEALQAAVSAVEGTGTTVLGIGIGDDTVFDAYQRAEVVERPDRLAVAMVDRKSTRLNSSHVKTSYAVFC